MNQPNFRVLMQGPRKARLEMYDVLGPSWAGMIDAKSVAQQLKDAGELDDIELHINSPGGSAWEGVAIHNILKDHPAKVHVVIDGVAASAASLVAMAGDTVRIPKNGMMMIHDPYTIAFGGVEDMKKAIKSLKATTASAIASYEAKSKQPADKIAQWMKDETWFVGQEAVDAGLADTTDSEVPLSQVEPKAQVQEMFAKAPSQFSSLFALTMRLTPEPPKMADPIVTPVAPVIAPVAPEAPPALTAADLTAAVQTALSDERTRTTTIMAICNRAGKPDLANEYIAANLSIADVNAKMVEVLCKDRPPVGDGEGANPKLGTDEDAAYKAEYSKDRTTYAKAGINEDEYVKMRRIDDGKDTLKIAAAA